MSRSAAVTDNTDRPVAVGPAARLLLVVIAGYRRWISPLLGPRCRFAPTCSAYAAEALAVHGAARGSGLALRRVLRCHPFTPGGHDPVPLVRPSCGTTSGEHGVTRHRPTTAPAHPSSPRRTGADPC